MSMNWSELIDSAEEGGGFDVLPAGDYLAVVQDATAQDASTGKPMVKATFKITEGPYAGRLIWNNFVLTRDNPNALKWFFRHMQAFGLQRDFFAMNPSMSAVAEQLKNKEVVITLTANREYQGQRQNDVKSIRAAGIPNQGPAPTPAPAPAPTNDTPSAEAQTNTGTAPPVPF